MTSTSAPRTTRSVVSLRSGGHPAAVRPGVAAAGRAGARRRRRRRRRRGARGGPRGPAPGAPGGGRRGRPVAAAKHSTFAPRFHFLTGALIAVGLAALAGVVLFIVAPNDNTNDSGVRNWSNWAPTTGGTAGAEQIAQHVGRPVQAGERPPDRERRRDRPRDPGRPAVRRRAQGSGPGRRHQGLRRLGVSTTSAASARRAPSTAARRRSSAGCSCAARPSSSRSTRSATSATSTRSSSSCRR